MTEDKILEEQKKKHPLFPKKLHPISFISLFKILAGHYPNCFSLTMVKILKVGILKDLIVDVDKHQLTKNKLRRFLTQYVNSPEYMFTHYKGAPRYDLQGNEVGVVTEQECIEKDKINKLYVKFRVENKSTNNS